MGTALRKFELRYKRCKERLWLYKSTGTSRRLWFEKSADSTGCLFRRNPQNMMMKIALCLSNTLRQRDFYCYWKYTELRTVDWELRYNESAQISLTLQVKNARISTPLIINLIMELPRPPKTNHLRNTFTLIYKIKQ